MCVELQQNSNASSREDYIPKILTVMLEIHRVYFWPLWSFNCLLSVIQCNYSVDQSALMTGFRTDFTSSVLYGISVSELQMFLHAKRLQLQRDGRNSCSFHRLLLLCLENLNIS